MMPLDGTGGEETGTVTIAGGSLYYQRAGKGPVLVFAHGIGGNYRSWWQQVPVLSQRFTCVTFSHRGFLPSTDETGSPRPGLYADDLEALLDHLGIGEVTLVAQSMGGWTALEFALRAPERLKALVLAGTTGSLRHPGIASMADTGRSPEVVRLRALGINPAAGERITREQPELYQTFVEIERSSGDWDRAPVRAALDRMRIRDAEESSVVRCPVLAIVGAEDLVCPPRNVEILASVLPEATLWQVPDAGHSVYFERASAFNVRLLAFLHEVGGIA